MAIKLTIIACENTPPLVVELAEGTDLVLESTNDVYLEDKEKSLGVSVTDDANGNICCEDHEGAEYFYATPN